MSNITRGVPPVHTGIIFKEMIIDLLPHMTVALAAKSLDVSPSYLDEIVKGQKRITPELATKIAKATGGSAEMWINMQVTYDLWEAAHNYSLTENVIALSLSSKDNITFKS
jgi:addiction module HigA family antidote